MQQFVIPGRLDALNDLIGADRANRYKGASMKKKNQQIVAKAIRDAGLRPIDGMFRVSFTWFEPNRRRDPDNISSGCKFILDALQEEGIIKGDSQKYVSWPIIHDGCIDKSNPRIEVLLEEVE